MSVTSVDSFVSKRGRRAKKVNYKETFVLRRGQLKQLPQETIYNLRREYFSPLNEFIENGYRPVMDDKSQIPLSIHTLWEQNGIYWGQGKVIEKQNSRYRIKQNIWYPLLNQPCEIIVSLLSQAVQTKQK